eukprot:Sspe_Gene.5240::Locus_1729_Transcript_3_6_Confidence_0.375_Length_2141::g.5240::m.5240/K15628/PXA; ATP-binding cassette, subfamily D (ALD), peroxisomal long-chain fatty acid import protein
MAAFSKTASFRDHAYTWKALIAHFGRTVWSVPPGKVLLTIWGSFLVWVLFRRPAKRLKGPKKAKGARPEGSGALLEIIKLLAPHVMSRHGLYFLAYVATLCTRILITVKLADQGGKLGSYMGSREWTKMFTGQAVLGLWFMSAAVATAVMKFLEKRVVLSVRGLLYRKLLEKYMDRITKPYYHVSRTVEDAPARLTADLEEFSTAAVQTLGHILKPSIDIIHLSTVIATRIGVPGLFVFLAFFYAAQKMLQRVYDSLPKSQKELAMEKQALEARLRSTHQQLHDFREQIAMQGGTEVEMAVISDRYRDVHKHQLQTAVLNGFCDVLSNYILKYGGAMCGFSVLIPQVYLGDPNARPEKVTAEYLSNQVLLATLATEIKDLAEAITGIPRVQGLATRVHVLCDAINKSLEDSNNYIVPGTIEEGVVIKGLTVAPPSSVGFLVEDLELLIKKGEHTVIKGPNGIGKTSLFRTLSGLWQPAKPPTKLKLPTDAIFMVPQDCYFPNDRHLADQITYPKPGSSITRQRAFELLRMVELEDLEKLWGEDCEWKMMLSGGQKQRLAWARMLFHAPTFAFIDEGTAGVTKQGADHLYNIAKEAGITLVSISHSPSIDAHHHRVLQLHGDGKFTFTDGIPQHD